MDFKAFLAHSSEFSHMAWIHGAGITQRQLQMNGQLCPYSPHMKPVVDGRYQKSHFGKKASKTSYLHDFSLFKSKIPSSLSGGQRVAYGTVKYKTKSAAQKSALNEIQQSTYVNSSIGMYYMQ